MHVPVKEKLKTNFKLLYRSLIYERFIYLNVMYQNYLHVCYLVSILNDVIETTFLDELELDNVIKLAKRC